MSDNWLIGLEALRCAEAALPNASFSAGEWLQRKAGDHSIQVRWEGTDADNQRDAWKYGLNYDDPLDMFLRLKTKEEIEREIKRIGLFKQDFDREISLLATETDAPAPLSAEPPATSAKRRRRASRDDHPGDVPSLPEPPDPTHLPNDRTGAPGRPTSAHLVRLELQRRKDCGELLPKIGAEARYLSEWLANTHQHLAPIKPRSAENVIRPKYNAWRARPEECIK
jgi:hypothetical protein